jgi:hypothetical protein
MTINNAWKLAPWADVLYACDFSWWNHHRGAPEFEGLKISQDSKASDTFKDVRAVRTKRREDGLLLGRPGHIGWGGNGGFQALNLAVQFGAKRIILVGYDMHLDRGRHWHGDHPKGLHNPLPGNVRRWRAAIDKNAPLLKAFGVTVINASMESALTAFPKMSLLEAFDVD